MGIEIVCLAKNGLLMAESAGLNHWYLAGNYCKMIQRLCI